MTILLVLIPLGVVLLGLAIGLFVWAVRNGQFEDFEGEGARILFDDLSGPAAAARAWTSTGGERPGQTRAIATSATTTISVTGTSCFT